MKGRSSTRRPERLIQERFARCFVDQYISLGLIGDGTSLRTETNPYGVKVCDCHKRGIYRCSCPRRYPDYYGYSLYELVASNSPAKLPLFVSVAQAPRNRSVLGVVALAEFRKLYAKAVWDSAHDSYDFYRLHHE
ncbi:MAG: hypothetical protein AB1497_09410, partial [Bacillota bacterium]